MNVHLISFLICLFLQKKPEPSDMLSNSSDCGVCKPAIAVFESPQNTQRLEWHFLSGLKHPQDSVIHWLIKWKWFLSRPLSWCKMMRTYSFLMLITSYKTNSITLIKKLDFRSSSLSILGIERFSLNCFISVSNVWPIWVWDTVCLTSFDPKWL